MNIKRYANNAIAVELLSRVVTNLRSITSGLDVKEIQQLAEQSVSKFRIDWNENNDLGMIVNRITHASELFDEKSIESLYTKVRSNDGYIDDTLDSIAAKLANFISPAMHTLRTVIHGECESLVQEISATTATDVVYKSDVQSFNWGRLSEPATEQVAILAAQMHADSIKTGVADRYAPARIARVMPVKEIEAHGGSLSLAEYIATLLSAEPDDMTKRFAKVLVNKPAFTMFVSDVKDTLNETNGNLPSKLVSMIQTLDKYLESAEKLEKLASFNTGNDTITEAVETVIRDNLKILSNEIHLAYAGAIFYRQTYKNVPIITKQAINTDALPFLMANGGTLDDACKHLRYVTQVLETDIPKQGISALTIIGDKEVATAAISAYDARLQQITDTKHREILQKSIKKTFSKHHASVESLVPSMTRDDIHSAAVMRASARAGKDTIDLYSIATEYLVSVNENKLVKSLYKKIDARFTQMVAAGQECTDKAVKASLSSSVIDTILNLLLKPYSEYKELEEAA